jgi:hypothetical protein
MLRVIDGQGTKEALNELGTLDEIAREGAPRMLMMALETEIGAYTGYHQPERDVDGRRLVLRNNKAKLRTVTCGPVTIEVQALRLSRMADSNSYSEVSAALEPFITLARASGVDCTFAGLARDCRFVVGLWSASTTPKMPMPSHCCAWADNSG